MKKLLIIEDNIKDFQKIYEYLKEAFPECYVYPVDENESKNFKKNIKAIFSPNGRKREAAIAFISTLKLDEFDGVILDYMLDTSMKALNGLSVYSELKLSNKALILTKFTAVDFSNVQKAIIEQKLEKNITAVQKASGPLTKEQKDEYTEKINSHIFGIVPINELPSIVILTALAEEYNSVAAHLSELSDVIIDGISYGKGVFKFEGRNIAKVLVRECGQRLVSAAQASEKAINSINPECMFFVGIAGSRKPMDFRIGDVLFAEKVFSYEGSRVGKDSYKARPEAENLSDALLEVARTERRASNWRQLIIGDFEVEEEAKADIGILASGNQLIEHLSSSTAEIIDHHYNATSAVEMEGYAFAFALRRQPVKKIEAAIIRGISDIIEKDGENQETSDRRPEYQKKYASATASAFTFWVIYKYYQR
jgi:nucleoside phosphorylase